MKHYKKLIGMLALSAFMLFQSGKSIAQKKNTLDAQLQGIELIASDKTHTISQQSPTHNINVYEHPITDIRPLAKLISESTQEERQKISYLVHFEPYDVEGKTSDKPPKPGKWFYKAAVISRNRAVHWSEPVQGTLRGKLEYQIQVVK